MRTYSNLYGRLQRIKELREQCLEALNHGKYNEAYNLIQDLETIAYLAKSDINELDVILMERRIK